MTAGAEPHELVSKLGPFLVTRVLGRGGMGIVYAGKHERTGVEVAIKTVRAGSTAFMSYVRHEASTLSRIRHPGVVQILGLGVEAGRPWYAMEILSGRTLSGFLAIDEVARGRMQGAAWTHTATSDYVSERRLMERERAEREAERQAEQQAERVVLAQQDLATLPLARESKLGALGSHGLLGALGPLGAQGSDAHRDGGSSGASGQIAPPPPPPPQKPIACDLPRMLPILRGICNALSFVHGEGVVHRDLKPDNIFICNGELPVLVDFGLASHVSADGRDVMQNVGGVAGSVGYMAPEQLRGELIDARCDLYALGCILYQLVTGRLPFEGSASRIIAGHLMDEPMPPGQLVSGLPTALDELIRGLLAKERDQRVGSAESVDDVLASIGGAPCRWATPLPAPQPFLYRPPFVGREGVLGQLVERLQQFTAAAQRAREDGAAANERDERDERDEPAGGLILIAGESGAGKTRLALEAVKLGTESSALTISCGCSTGGSPLQPLRELFRALVEHCIATDNEAAIEGVLQASGHPTHRPTGDTGEQGFASAAGAPSSRSLGASLGGPVDARAATGLPRLDGPGSGQSPRPPRPSSEGDRSESPLARSAGSESRRVLGSGAAVLALYSPEIAELPWVAELPEPEPLPSVAARARVLRTLTLALRELARTRPLLLTLDDLHLADGFTLELLAHLQAEHARGEGPRMLVLCTYRSEERTAALDGLAALPGTLHLVVERMSEVEVGQMVRGMLALPDPPTAFVSFLARESGGNPFFVAEYLRTAVAERVLVRDQRGRWRIADTSVPTEEICEALPLPRSLRQVVELRLGKLAPRTRQVLDAAAVIGRRFTGALLAAVMPISEEALLEALDEMVAALVIEPIDEQSYRFVHDKLHELPAAAQAPAQRRDLHARIAAAMERIYGESGGEHEGTIGRHWAAGGYPERAARRLGSAGDHARKVHSVDTAIELYRAARRQVELVLGDAGATGDAAKATSWHAQACALDEKLGDALAFSSQHALARDAFEMARQHLGKDQPILRARLSRKIAKSWESVHAYPDALAGYAELEAQLVATPERIDELEPEWIHLMLGRAWIYYWSNRVDEMNVAIDLVRPMLEARGSPLDRYRFYLALVTRDYRRDRFRVSAETLEFGRECVAAAREANSPSEIAFARFVRGFGLLFAGQLREAEGEIEAALQTARRISDAVVETRSISYLAMLHALTGNLEEAQATATAALEMSRARKMGDYEAMSLAVLGRLAHMAGDAAKAAELCQKATAIWNAMMAYPFPFRWIAGLPMLEQGLGRLAEPEGGGLPALVELARELCAADQHHLPDPLDAALRAAIAASAEPAQVIEAHLRHAITLAYQLGYMRESP